MVRALNEARNLAAGFARVPRPAHPAHRQHVDGWVEYVEVWNEPNAQRYWTTGTDTNLTCAALADWAGRAAGP